MANGMELNARAFGAAGDGLTDDTAALQQAVDAAAQSGVALFLPRGRYRIRSLRIPDHLTLFGQSAWGYVERKDPPPGRAADPEGAGNTVLIAADGDAPAMLVLDKAFGTRITGLSLDGGGLGRALCGIAAKEGGALCFEDVRMQRLTGACLSLEGTDGFAVRRCLLIHNESHAVQLEKAQNGIILDSQLSYNRGAGLYGRDADRLLVIANRIEGGCPGGVYLDVTSGVTINGNSFDTAYGPAVTLLRTTGGSVTGNMTRLCGHDQQGVMDAHIRLGDARGVTVSGNSFWGWPDLRTNPWLALYGIVGENLTDCVITGNSMFESCREEMVSLRGVNRNVLVRDNAGRVCPWTPPEAPAHG